MNIWDSAPKEKRSDSDEDCADAVSTSKEAESSTAIVKNDFMMIHGLNCFDDKLVPLDFRKRPELPPQRERSTLRILRGITLRQY